MATPGRLARALAFFFVVVCLATLFALMTGYQPIEWSDLRTDEIARTIFFRLRVPRVVLGLLVGGSLAGVGAALQALFRNPLAEPFTLGVSGGGALGASVAIALGFGANVAGVPLVFIFAFAGSIASVAIVYRLASAGTVVMPGTLLLAGVVLNLIAGAGVLMIQFVTDYTRALQILRWMVGSLDVIGMDLVWRMLIFLVPGMLLLLATTRDLHLIAVDEESAAALGVNVRRVERIVYAASSLVVGVTVAVAGPIGFVGLIVPHAVRRLFGEDLRIVIPCSILLGAAFLVLADSLARTILGASELPVGAVTALIGGPLFLILLTRRRRYAAI
ncbi:MAG: iron ABC transporter permease [Acidobacteriota bacterium]|nr:MAG: iron ABC transporter permease [Acidobacteriota bacterium]